VNDLETGNLKWANISKEKVKNIEKRVTKSKITKELNKEVKKIEKGMENIE